MQITSLELQNFKCFKNVDLSFADITLLTGANSSGKSSILYSILGALQSSNFPSEFNPNGKYVRMGDYKDIVRLHDDRNTISIKYTVDSGSSSFDCSTTWKQDRKTLLPELQELLISGSYYSIKIWKVKKYHLSFKYDQERDPSPDINTSEFYTKITDLFSGLSDNDEVPNRLNEKWVKYSQLKEEIHFIMDSVEDVLSEIMEKGNFTLQRIYGKIADDLEKLATQSGFISSFRLFPERTYYDKSENDLTVGRFGESFEDQIIDWKTRKSAKYDELLRVLKEMSLVEDINPNRMTGGRYELLVKTNKKGPYSSISDVGFGISQFLPIVVADLQLGSGSTLYVAQPEIHLHPAVQARFGNYLVDQVSANANKYVLETHSEYLINRLRKLIIEGKVKEDQVKCFHVRNVGEYSRIYPISFLKNGEIKGAPKDFFETYMLDVMDIALNSNE